MYHDFAYVKAKPYWPHSLLLEASYCIKLLITGKFAQSVLHFFKVKVKQELHWNMFRTMNCILSFLRENRCAVGRMPCFYFQTRPCASSVIYMHVLFCFCSFPFAYCSRQKRKQYSLCSEAVSSRDQRSERHIFERRCATAFHFVVSGSKALSSAHSPVI